MKYLKVLVLSLLLSASTIASADKPPTDYQCNVVSSMAGTVQRVRVEYGVTVEEMRVRAIAHTPLELRGVMLEVINIVYSGVSPEATPEDVYTSFMISCIGVEV